MKPLIRTFTAAALALSLVSGAAGQSRGQQQPEMTPLVERLDVRVINIDVVVTDKKGNPIHGLTKDDFILLENGVEKPISNFYEVQGNTAKNQVVDSLTPPVKPETAVAPRDRDQVPDEMRRRIIFYVDNLSLNPFNRNRVFKEMKEFAKANMRPGDEAMVATFNRSMKVRVAFTRDPLQIAQTLDGIAGESAMGGQNVNERKQAEDRIRDARSYDEAVGIARTYAASVEHDLRQSVASINALMATLAGVEGKKVLVLTSEGFPMQPGREMFYFIDETAREKNWGNAGSSLLEGMTYDGSRLIQEVAKTANANGITMYTVHAAGLTGGNEMSAEHSRATPYSVSYAAQTNTTESMQLIADMTGGVASVGTNNFADAFRKIQRDLESYYSLGYRGGTERVDRQRYIQVKVKNKAYIARARQTFVEKSVFAEMSDRVIANLLYRTKDNDLGVLVRMGRPRPTDQGFYQVPVEIQIPMEALTLMPQGEVHVGGFDVYVVVANKENDMSDVARKQHQMRLTAEDMGKIKGKYYTYTLELVMEKGLNKVSIGVVDQISNTSGFAREQIIAQDLR